ncbi:MAG: 2-C-methyl-D-erythritol 2,4-cyclodiphosphate synthase [Rickettsiales bacterium]|jgi:2-C-methyl-D-erythritol 4-phosphate cytidylyltransferase/2-C-methyl-D-erythritol 2,4-cyclodiphosphate synthase|nr:2-C-methyl-D-erythritol 2,4-cyclodiphosphate synthase [Rickettsiales bacterium]
MKTIAVIVAGGSGSRFGSSIPKQYVSSILTKTIKQFLKAKIDAVQVVIRPEDIELYNQATCNMELLPVVFGGDTRGASVKNGLQVIEKYNAELVLVHDANRAFVSVELINQVIDKLKENPGFGVVPSIEVPETVKSIVNGRIESVDRDNLFLIQTPQGFYFKRLLEAYTKTDKFFTDESSLMEGSVIYIPGDRKNIKITYQEDLPMDIRCGSGFDAHKFSAETSENNNVVLGGITIPFEKKLEAHSDGDVLIHALVDAILGAIGEGDIGMHFPPSDMKWKNASSEQFLVHAKKLLENKNGSINNVDITVICEKPRLGVYREKIRSNLSNILGIFEDRVNIKATTTEKMGFTGRGEGIAVQTMVSVSL